MKIGIIGTGHIGGTLAQLWGKANHQVILSSRHPQNLEALAKTIGPNASTATPEEAARLGEVILLSIPLYEIPTLRKEVLTALRGKIVMDTSNAYPDHYPIEYRAIAEEALNASTGSGLWVAQYLPDVKIVKAFNTVYSKTLGTEAHRKTEPLGIPLASDDPAALQIIAKLVQEAGFGPVIVGELRRAKEFDRGSIPYDSEASVSELKKMLGLS